MKISIKLKYMKILIKNATKEVFQKIIIFEFYSRQLVLWASSSPLLSVNQGNTQSVAAMQSIHNHEMNVLITAGTDMRVRYWDLQNPEHSYIVCGSSNEKVTSANVSYK